MLINIRGTNGSGKSTLVRGVLKAGFARPLYGVLGLKQPEAYACTIPEVRGLVYVLGPYQTNTGGMDRFAYYGWDSCIATIEKYAEKGHVIFESVTISSCYGSIGVLLEKWGKDSVVAFLTTSAEDCITNVNRRRKGVSLPNTANLLGKHGSTLKVRERMLSEGKVTVVDVTMENGLGTILKLLREDG